MATPPRQSNKTLWILICWSYTLVAVTESLPSNANIEHGLQEEQPQGYFQQVGRPEETHNVEEWSPVLYGTTPDDSESSATTQRKRSTAEPDYYRAILSRRSAMDRNFMRFGRSGEVNRNFMRFGRRLQDNFIRFGKALRQPIATIKIGSKSDSRKKRSIDLEDTDSEDVTYVPPSMYFADRLRNVRPFYVPIETNFEPPESGSVYAAERWAPDQYSAPTKFTSYFGGKPYIRPEKKTWGNIDNNFIRFG